MDSATIVYYDPLNQEVPPSFTTNEYTFTKFTSDQLPERYAPGYIFHGWYSSTYGNKVTVGSLHKSLLPSNHDGSDITLIAKWERLHYVTDTPLKNIGNAIRDLWGIEDTLTLEEMVSYIDIPYEEILTMSEEYFQQYKIQIGKEKEES